MKLAAAHIGGSAIEQRVHRHIEIGRGTSLAMDRGEQRTFVSDAFLVGSQAVEKLVAFHLGNDQCMLLFGGHRIGSKLLQVAAKYDRSVEAFTNAGCVSQWIRLTLDRWSNVR